MNKFICGLTLAAITSGAALAATPVGIANVFGAKSWEQAKNPPYGMYSFALGKNAEVKNVTRNVVPANFGGVYADGRFFAIEGIATSASSFITNYIYDATTWEKITDFQGENITAFDMAWDQTTGNVYGYFHSFDTGEEFFGTINLNTGTTTRISQLPFVAYGMGADVEGQIYAVAKNGDFYKIDKTTGTSQLIAKTAAASAWTTSGTVDSATRTFYFATCNDTRSELYAINLDSGEATMLQIIPDNMELTGLYIPEPSALPDAPAAATDLTLDFPQGDLSGNIIFTIPATLFGGSAASGTVSYKVMFDGKELKSATAAYGDRISIPASVASAGEYELTVTLSNSTGSAPTVRLKSWVGPDVPAPVGKVELTYDGNGTFSLSWPEAKALHGGWFDPATVTYNVVRYGESTTRFDGQTENSFTDKVSLPYEDEYATYHYEVAAVFGSTAGSYSSSEYYTIGSKTPPFSEGFNARWDLGKFTIFEGEKKDYERWSYDSSGKAVTLTTNTSTGADDYLLLPPLMLEKGMKYQISFDAKGKYSSDIERFEVLAGLAPTVDELKSVVQGPTDITSTSYQTFPMEFAPSESGAWFVAIHAISDPNKGAITIDNIKVGAGVTTAVESIESEQDAAPEYFTLQGTRVANPAHGLFIERRGSKVRKVMIP